MASVEIWKLVKYATPALLRCHLFADRLSLRKPSEPNINIWQVLKFPDMRVFVRMTLLSLEWVLQEQVVIRENLADALAIETRPGDVDIELEVYWPGALVDLPLS
jgi:hypothetical protein